MLKPDRCLQIAGWILRLAVAVQCVALGVKHVFGATPVNDFLVLRDAAMTAYVVDYVAGFGLPLLAGMVLARPLRWVLVVIAGWFLFYSVVAWLNHAPDADAIFYQLAPPGQAVRWMAPIGLALLLAGWTRAAMWALLLAGSATFIAHGLKDVLLYNPYIDIINNSLARHTEMTWPLARTQTVLRVIGVLDIAAAGLLVLTRWRWIALGMAGWGAVAALSRITANGWEVWPECLIRVCNVAVPFVVFLLLCQFNKSHRQHPGAEH